MKLDILHEQVVGHWEKIYHPGHIDPKYRKKKKKQDLSFRIKGKKKIKDPEGGIDKTQALETGARPIGYGKTREMGMKAKAEVRGGSDRLHGSGRVAGGELNAWRGNKSKGIEIRQ